MIFVGHDRWTIMRLKRRPRTCGKLGEHPRGSKRFRHASVAIAKALFVLGCFASVPALAGEYRLVQGQGNRVCEAYRQTLEPRRDAEPMACTRRYDPHIPGFSSPPWHMLDLATNFDLYRKAWIYLQKNNSAPQGTKLSDAQIEEQAKRDLPGVAQTHHVALFIAQLDLTGSGANFNVLAVEEDGCGPRIKHGRVTRLFVLDSTAKNVNTTVPRIWNSGYNDTIEIYRGVPYDEHYESDDNWANILTHSGALTVSRWTQEGLQPVCKIEWTPKANSQE